MFIRIALLCGIGLRVVAAQGPLINYVTYLGGSYSEGVAGIAVDSAGSAYVAGGTSSPDFPVTSTSLGTPTATAGCAFVTKFNPSGTAIDFSVCVANSGGTAFALDTSGNIYLAGRNAVLKLDPSAQNILYTTAIGGYVESMAVDAVGNVYVAGAAGPGLATTPGAYQKQYPGGQCPGSFISTTPCNNAFITKLTPTGSVAWTTYLGGSGPDDAHAIAVDGAGNVWVVGETVSPNFPTTSSAISRTFHGELHDGPLLFGDAFVAKLDSTGSHLLYSTYLGGSGADGAFGLAVDATGAVYVAGGTQSPNFPTTAGAFETTNSGYNPNQEPSLIGNGFVTKLDTSGKLVYSTLTGLMNGVATPIRDAFLAKVDFSQPAGPTLASVRNAASLVPGYASPFPTGAVAPGEIVTLFGNGFGSAQPAVNFSQYPATVLYASNCQINAVVPFEVTPGFPTFVTVQSGEQTLGPVRLPVVVAAPGIFTTNESGSGQAAILNQDSTPNSPSNPAARGSIVSVYMTGAGALNPPIADGSLGPLIPPFPVPVAGVSAIIGSVAAPLTFVGQAPGLIAGATQVNVQIPRNAPVGAAIPITIYVADYTSQYTQSVTMAVR